MTPSWLSPKTSWVLAVLAVVAFEAAYEIDAGAAAVVVYLACLFSLAWVKTPRLAFYLGLAIGSSIAGMQLWFFFDIFGPAAVGLWAILGLWIAFYLLLSRIVVERWPNWGLVWIPVIWFGLEYFRSELYYLRFAWLTPGLGLSLHAWSAAGSFGVYGISLLVMALFVLVRRASLVRCLGAAAIVALIAGLWVTTSDSSRRDVVLVGIQLEGPSEDQVLDALDRADHEVPNADLFVLSEYCFDGPVPPAVGDWCARHQKHLVAGGKKPIDDGGRFIDTAFVISPTGEVIFEQGKSVPIQFFNDGLPAREQKLWESPWGKIGLAICYDLSYSRVIDRLVADGAQALIIPTMDAESWGEHEHRLHARIAPTRAREYGIPIFRLASSGISQLVDREGNIVATAPFPGQGELLAGRMTLRARGQLPLDRYLALPAVMAVGVLLVYLAIVGLRDRSPKKISKSGFPRFAISV